MIDTALVKALQQRVIGAIRQLPAVIPIQAIGVPFDPPNDKRYFELVIVPFDTADYWGSETQFSGYFNVILYWPADGTGIYPKLGFLEQLREFFVKGETIFAEGYRILINERPRIGAPVRGNIVTGRAFSVSEHGQDTMTVLSIPYGCFAAEIG